MNPDHLFLGTDGDNAEDMARKWRGTRSAKGLPFGVLALPSGRFGARLMSRRHGWLYLGVFDSAAAATAAARAAKLKRLDGKP